MQAVNKKKIIIKNETTVKREKIYKKKTNQKN